MFTRVQGNTMLFAMPLQGKTFYAGAIVVDDFVPESGDEITVIMQDRRAYTYTPTYTDGMLIWTDNGQLEVGTYSVEVLVDRQDGTHLRCLRLNQVNIVESTEESELDSEMDGNGVYPSDVLSAAVFLFAGNGNLGIREIAQDVFNTSIGAVQTNIVNGYTSLIGSSIRPIIPDMWASLTGNTGDYMNTLINANHIPIGNGLSINIETGRIDVIGGGGGAVHSVAGLTGEISAQALSQALSLGAAASKGIGTVADGNTDLVTGGAVYSAIQSITPGGSGVSEVRFGDPTAPAEKDKLVVTKLGTDYYHEILFAQVARKTRFTYTADGTTHTDAEFPIDWLISEEYETGHYRLRVNPKYDGICADGWVAAGGVGSGGGGGGVTLNAPLSVINSAGLSNPSVNGSVLTWDSTNGWGYKTPSILGSALASINGANLAANPGTANMTIVWDGSKWDYLAVGGGGGDVTWSALGTWDSTHKIASGYIKIGSGLTVNSNGEIEATGGSATGLTWSDLSGDDSSKKIHSSHIYYGAGLSVDSNGLLYVTSSGDTYYAGTGISINYANYISVNYGTTSGTACQGNDSRLSDSRPASDVYSWAKAATKPSYDYSEISNTPSVTTYKLNINGSWSGDTTSGTSLGTVYGPTSAGTSGYTLIANSSGIPSWSSMIQVGSGGIDVAGTIDATGGISSSSYVAAGGIASSSDRRLKDKIETINSERALSVLMGLVPREWEWNDKNGFLFGKHCAGFVAQEVSNILPFAVMDVKDYLSLNYSVLHAYEIAGFQNHENRIAKLEKQLEYYAAR